MNGVYTKFMDVLADGSHDWENSTFRCLLIRDTSTYVFDPDHDFVSDFTGNGGAEISVASYSRQTLTTNAAAPDDANDRLELDTDNISFGALESGQTVKGAIVYIQVGGDDTTPGNDVLVCHIDGIIEVVLAADAALNDTTIWVEPLDEDLADGTSLDFGSSATCSLNGAATAGDRELTVTALGAAASAGATSDADADNVLPAALGNGDFTIQIDTEGLIHLAG